MPIKFSSLLEKKKKKTEKESFWSEFVTMVLMLA